MSSSRFGETVDIHIGRSKMLGGALIVVHAGAVVLLGVTTLPFWAQLLIAASVLVSVWHAFSRYVILRGADAITGLHCDGTNQWRVRFRAGHSAPATILPSSYVHPWLVVLNLRINKRGRCRSSILLRDNIDAQAFRRLRVRLLLAKADFTTARSAAISKPDAA